MRRLCLLMLVTSVFNPYIDKYVFCHIPCSCIGIYETSLLFSKHHDDVGDLFFKSISSERVGYGICFISIFLLLFSLIHWGWGFSIANVLYWLMFVAAVFISIIASQAMISRTSPLSNSHSL